MSDAQIPAVTLRLRSFGSPAVEGPAGPLEGCAAQRQVLALLTLVATAGDRGLSRDKIVALLWPETDARRSGHRLSQLLHALRRSLGDDILTAAAGEIRLNPDRIGSDVYEFKAMQSRGELERAVACYSGPFLDGFYLGEAPEFERWVEAERAEFKRAFTEALESLAIEAETREDSEAAAHWWSRLAEVEPLSTRVVMRLMAALAARGDRAGALHQAERYEVGVDQELEAAPNPAVLALADKLRRSPERRFSVALTPITVIGSASDHHLAEGLFEELTHGLGHLEGIRVVVMPPLGRMSRGGLNGILEGSLRQIGDRIRIIFHLLDPENGSQLWSNRYERVIDDVFAVQDELTKTILEDLRPVLKPR